MAGVGTRQVVPCHGHSCPQAVCVFGAVRPMAEAGTGFDLSTNGERQWQAPHESAPYNGLTAKAAVGETVGN